MSSISPKLRKWVDPATGNEGLTYWCQGCGAAHGIRTKGPGAWTWNGDVDKPVFGPSVRTTWENRSTNPPTKRMCHTFVGRNGAKPVEVVFLSDCTHALAGRVEPFPDLPDWLL